MSRKCRKILKNHCIVIHSYGTEFREDISFQKTAWPLFMKEEKLVNFLDLCSENDVMTDDLAVISFSMESGSEKPRFITEGEKDVLNRTGKEGNIIITDKDNITLMGWAADCCLVGLCSKDGKVRAVVHASCESLALQSIVSVAVSAIYSHYGVSASDLSAFVGACVRDCCYDYDTQRAREVFDDNGFGEFITPTDDPDKVKFDLYGAVRRSLTRAGVMDVMDVFTPECQCTICSKEDGENFMFHSYRRMKCKDREGKDVHYNGQYCLVMANDGLIRPKR